MTFRTLLSLSSLRDKTNETSPISAKQSSFFRSQNEFYDLLTIPSCNSAIVHHRRKQRKAYGKWFDFPCHYTNSNPHDVLRAIKVSRVPVGRKNLKRLVSAIETENLKNFKAKVHIVNCIVNGKLQKLKNLKRIVSATETENFKISKQHLRILRFLAESSGVTKLELFAL